MALEVSAKQLVIIIISIFGIISGILLLGSIEEIKDIFDAVKEPETESIVVEVTPGSSQTGTLFFMKAKTSRNRETQNLVLDVESEGTGLKGSVNLFDDGVHFDSDENDGIYGGHFNSENWASGKYLIKNNQETLSEFYIHEKGCETIEGEYDDDKINFVFVPSGYESYGDFKENVDEVLNGRNGLLTIDPFDSRRNFMSFSTVDTERVECEPGCRGYDSFVCCGNKEVYEEASRCHADSIIVLVNDDRICGQASDYAKVCGGGEYAGRIIAHELGHSFGDLADEYIYEEIFDFSVDELDAPNCDLGGCEKWSSNGEGCYEGCTSKLLFRPSETSIMKDVSVPWFNIVSENHLKKVIVDYILDEKEVEKKSEERSYYVNMKYKEGGIDIEGISLKPIKPNLGIRKSNYSIEITNNERVIFERDLYVPVLENQLEGFNGGIVENDNFIFSVLVPFFQDAENLEIKKSGIVVEEEPLSVFSDSCGNGICEKSENRLSCSADCTIEDNFCEETTECDPDCPGKDCEFERKRKYYIFGLVVLVLSLTILLYYKKFIKIKN